MWLQLNDQNAFVKMCEKYTLKKYIFIKFIYEMQHLLRDRNRNSAGLCFHDLFQCTGRIDNEIPLHYASRHVVNNLHKRWHSFGLYFNQTSSVFTSKHTISTAKENIVLARAECQFEIDFPNKLQCLINKSNTPRGGIGRVDFEIEFC